MSRTGEAIGCFGLTEPDHGADPAGLITRAQRVPEGWLLNGAKMWITNGTIADVAVVWARTEEGIRGFLVEKGTRGYTAPEMRHKFSLRASVTSELVFQDCLLPEENLLLGTTGVKSALQCLNQARADRVSLAKRNNVAMALQTARLPGTTWELTASPPSTRWAGT